MSIDRDIFVNTGQKIARANAKQSLWPLLGYALAERLSASK